MLSAGGIFMDQQPKELEALRQSLRQEYLAIQRYEQFAASTDNPQVRQQCLQFAEQHRRRYLRIQKGQKEHEE